MKKKKKLRIGSILLTFVLVCIGCVGGYMIGSKIADKYFIVDIYAGISADQLVDDITKLGWEKKTPDKLTPAEAFQVAEFVLSETERYQIIGQTDLQTSLGVSQGTISLDQRLGEDYRFEFVTYSKFVKLAKLCDYKLNGDIVIYDGTPNSATLEDVKWSDKHDDFTWEGYKETFGKYANRNCSYYVCNATTLKSEFIKKEGENYTFKIDLDPIKSTVCYATQIGTNMGINPSSIKFDTISVTFTIDSEYHFIQQQKLEIYSLPYMGVTVGLEGNIETSFNYDC